MKNTRFFITVLLVITLALSIFAFSACNLFTGGNDNPPIGGGGEKDLYSVSFVSGADDATGTAPETKTYEEGSTFKLPSNPFKRDDYTFKGWNDGSKVYSAGANYTIGKKDVVFTVVWEELDDDAPAPSELDDKFYDASNWVYMTNNDGADTDGGDIPYSMTDGSIKFHRANQAIEMGDMTNATVSFMLKATNDFSVWFNSSSKDNNNNSSYRLAYAYGGLRIALSSAPEQAAALIGGDLYKKGEWNRFDIVFSTVDRVTEIKLYINGVRATLSAGDNTTPAISVANNVLTHTQPAMFHTGNYMVVKVWEAHNFVQLKPVAKADEEDPPIIACIGASITEGASANNFYTESYPAQLQNALAGAYNVINFGNSGKTVREDLGDTAWIKQYQWQGVQAIVPDIAILNIGTNDSKSSNNPATTIENFYAAFTNLVDKLLEVNPDMQIIVCTVPYAYTSIYDISNDNIANIIAPVQRQVAEERGYTLIDLYEYTQNKTHLFPDGVHPNTKGYEMIVKIIKKALLEGQDALTDEFIAEINEQYKPLVPNAYVELESVVIDDMTLTLKGTTNDPGLKFFVGQDPTNTSVYNYYEAITASEDGSFTYSFDLTTMPLGTGWYNVRLYFTDENYYVVPLNKTVDGEGESVDLWSKVILETTQIEISSWDDGGVGTLSFNVQAYTKPSYSVTVTGGSIVEADGKIMLTVTGTTNDSAAKLLVGPEDDLAKYGHAITVNGDGSFSVSFDLAALEVSGSWQNAKIFMSDGNSVVVSYDKLGVNTGDIFYAGEKKIVVKTWGGENILSLSVEAHNPNYFLKGGQVSKDNVPASITQEGDKVYFNFYGEFNGDASVERTIELVLTLEDAAERPESLDASKIVYTASNTYSGDSNTEFSFKMNATDDIGVQGGSWIRLVLKITEGDTVSYYTIKPVVPGHTGDWVACDDPITLDGVKYEMAICWSSFFFQVNNG